MPAPPAVPEMEVVPAVQICLKIPVLASTRPVKEDHGGFQNSALDPETDDEQSEGHKRTNSEPWMSNIVGLGPRETIVCPKIFMVYDQLPTLVEI
jgi:hypothetical protein